MHSASSAFAWRRLAQNLRSDTPHVHADGSACCQLQPRRRNDSHNSIAWWLCTLAHLCQRNEPGSINFALLQLQAAACFLRQHDAESACPYIAPFIFPSKNALVFQASCMQRLWCQAKLFRQFSHCRFFVALTKHAYACNFMMIFGAQVHAQRNHSATSDAKQALMWDLPGGVHRG